MDTKQYIRKIFKNGSNGKTSSDVVTIPKKIVQELKLEGKKVIITLENENTIRIIPRDDISENILKKKKKKESMRQVHDFASWD